MKGVIWGIPIASVLWAIIVLIVSSTLGHSRLGFMTDAQIATIISWVAAFALATIPAFIARWEGRRFFSWWLFSMLLFPVALI